MAQRLHTASSHSSRRRSSQRPTGLP